MIKIKKAKKTPEDESSTDEVIEGGLKVKFSRLHRTRKRKIITIATVLLAVIGVLFAVPVTRNSILDAVLKRGAASDTGIHTLKTKAPKAVVSNNPTVLAVQLDERIDVYDTKTGNSKTVTDKVPVETCYDKYAKILNFYYKSDTEWRYYAQSCSNANIYYADQSTPPVLLQKFNTNAQPNSIVANAEKKIYAYSVVTFFGDPHATTKTFISYGNKKPAQLYESAAYIKADMVNNPDPSSYTYLVRDISPVADKLLFQQERCFECDGGVKANLFLLDTKSGSSELINKSETDSGFAHFDADGNVMITSGIFHVPWGENHSIDLTTYLFKKAGKVKAYGNNDKLTESYAIDANGSFVLTRNRDGDSNYSPGKLYKLSNGVPTEILAELGKYSIEAPYDYSLGKSAGGCVSAFFRARDPTANKSDESVGVICKDSNAGIYRYKPLISTQSTTTYSPDDVATLL